MYAAFYDPANGAIKQRGTGVEAAVKATAAHLELAFLELTREQYRLPLETSATVQNGALVMDPTGG